MRIPKFWVKICALLFSFVFIMIVSPHTHASANGGITVSPSITSLDLKTDKPTLELLYTNTTQHDVELHLSAQNFKDLNEGYGVKFLEEKESENYQYALASWLSFDNPVLLIPSQGKENVTIYINDERLSPGGHYAAILAEIRIPENDTEVKVRGILSSLLFVRASTGKVIEELELQDSGISTTGFFPEKLWLKVKNSGNVELSPHGLITINNPFGKEVARAYLNEGSNIILPESIRTFETKITKPESLLLPGYYKATLKLRYGTEGKEITQSFRFFSWGNERFIKTLAGTLIVVLIAGIAFYFVTKQKPKKIRLQDNSP